MNRFPLLIAMAFMLFTLNKGSMGCGGCSCDFSCDDVKNGLGITYYGTPIKKTTEDCWRQFLWEHYGDSKNPLDYNYPEIRLTFCEAYKAEWCTKKYLEKYEKFWKVKKSYIQECRADPLYWQPKYNDSNHMMGRFLRQSELEK